MGYKKQPDNDEVAFNFEYVSQDAAMEVFLSNLQMVGNTVYIRTSKNLNWTIKDVILLGREDRVRYQLVGVSKVRKNITKNFYVSRVTYDYILALNS